MSNIKDLRPAPVKLELGGKERELKYDLNAFAELENRFGSVEAAMEDLQKGSMQSVKMILWAGLIHEEAIIDDKTGEPTGYNITPYQVGAWIDPRMLAEMTQKLSEAMKAAMPDNIEELTKKALEAEPVNTKMATVVLTPEEKAEAEKKV